MMDSLYTAQTGLKVSRYSVDVTSNNIANENTVGYKKRIVQTSEMDSLENNLGNGVSFDGVKRSTNLYFYDQILTQNSISSYYEQQNTILSNAEMLFQETEDSGVSVTLNNFFSSIESLRGDPTSSVYKNDIESNAQMLVSGIQSIYSDLEELQENSLTSLKDQVDEVNSMIKEITYINKKIRQNGETNDLLDKRDLLEKKLSSYADVDVNTDNDNYKLTMAGETVIFNNTNLSELSVDEEYIQQKDIYTTTDLNDSSITSGDTINITLNNDISISVTANTTGAPDYDVKQQIVDAINNSPEFNSVEAYLDTTNNLVIRSVEGGEDSAFDIKIDVNGTVMEKSDVSVEAANNISVSVYNEKLDFASGSLKSLTEELTTETSEISSYKKSLDDFAKALVESFAEKSGSTTMFKGASVNTLEFINGSVFSLSNSDLESLSEIQWDESINIDSNSSETTSFREFYEDLLVTVSSNVEDNAFKQDAQDAVLNSLQSTYDNLTKVDGDQEQVNLLKYQAAYTANAKVITAVDEMLDTLLNM
ncbi:flagellar hook-associated protein FlgK [Halarcobacter anaerophilus]|uniref:flagellar hook-associated protein FlgK n=1 Tax=Halarcobacter anaerophilus TaxID=877500 RepID=UPI0005C9A021|nr:flagellar basal body rod C-terminal domain-containing protein [Halarcobacter anaerophilus]